MKKIIYLIIIVVAVLILAMIAQKYTSFKVFSPIKNFFNSIALPAPTYPPADKQLNIFIRDLRFIPNMNAIEKGARVTWYNEDDKTHTVTGEGWDSGQLVPGQAFSKIFDQPGDFKYHCSIHPEMTGEIIVQ